MGLIYMQLFKHYERKNLSKAVKSFIRRLKFKLDIPEGEEFEQKLDRLKNFAPDEVTDDITISKLLEINQKYLKAIKTKKYFSQKKK